MSVSDRESELYWEQQANRDEDQESMEEFNEIVERTDSSTSSSRRTTSRSNSSSSSSTTSTTANTSTSNSTTPSVSTTSSVSTSSSNGNSAVAGTSTSIAQVAAEPITETQAEIQAVAAAEEIPVTSGQPSGQYIYAPAEGAELWGSFENDTLVGGAGDDIFYGGKDQGSDTFLNVSSTDKVYLSDVTFNDLSGVKKENDMITFTFKNGNSVNIQSSESASGTIVLADSTWNFQHTPQAQA